MHLTEMDETIGLKANQRGDLQDGGGVRRGDHLPPHKYIYMWNNSYRTPTERWQKTSDFPKGNRHLRAAYMQRRGQTKAEPQVLWEQRREREISRCSLRSSGLNAHNQLDETRICGIPEWTTNVPKIEAMGFGSNCRLGVCFLHLICFWFLCSSRFSF